MLHGFLPKCMWRFQPLGELRSGADCQLLVDEVEPWTNWRHAKDPIDPWISISCFNAARYCMDNATAYRLEQRFAASRGQATPNWYYERMRWPSISRGKLLVRRRVRADDRSVVERLMLDTGEQALPWLVANAPFWRSITPKRLNVPESVEVAQECNALRRPPVTQHLREAATFADFMRSVSVGLDEPGARSLDAVSRLWAYLRRAQGTDGLLVYLACYLAWRRARTVLQSNPIFAGIVDEIYAYTSGNFGSLIIAPSCHESLQRLAHELELHGMRASCWGSQVLVDLAHPQEPEPPSSGTKRRNPLGEALAALLTPHSVFS